MAFLEDTVIVLVSQVGSVVLVKRICSQCFCKLFLFQIFFFCGGLVFFVKQLFKNYEIKHISIQLIFSITFALSLTLFELIIFEIAGVLESSSRFLYWRLVLIAILIMVVAVIPYHIAHSLISTIRIGKKLERENLCSIFNFNLNCSAKSLLKPSDNHSLAWLSLLLLANRRSVSSSECQPRNLHNRARRVKDWSCWSHCDGNSFGFRSCEFSVH